MRVKASSVGLPAEEYRAELAIETGYTGMSEVDVTRGELDDAVRRGVARPARPPATCRATPAWCCISERGSALGRVTADKQVRLVRGDREAFGLRGRSAEQRVALDLLLDPDIGIVSLGGRAGTGKSALALCAGLEAVLERRQHRKVVVFRPLFAVGGQELGYLPGNESEKMQPWAQAVFDTLGAVTSTDVIEEVLARGMLEVLPLTHIRGRSLHDAFVVVDEAQSLERNVLLTVLSRVGANSRVVLTHDVAQRDNLRVGRSRRCRRGGREAQGSPAVRARDADPLRALADRRAGDRDAGGLSRSDPAYRTWPPRPNRRMRETLDVGVHRMGLTPASSLQHLFCQVCHTLHGDLTSPRHPPGWVGLLPLEEWFCVPRQAHRTASPSAPVPQADSGAFCWRRRRARFPPSGVTGAVALVGAAGVAVGLGIFTVDAEAGPAGTPTAASGHFDVNTSGCPTTPSRRGTGPPTTRSAAPRSVRRCLACSARPRPSTCPVTKQDVAGAVTETVEATDPRDIAMSMLGDYGWSSERVLLPRLALGAARATGTSTPPTPPPAPTASRRRCRPRRWRPPVPTGGPTRRPRSSGASPTSESLRLSLRRLVLQARQQLVLTGVVGGAWLRFPRSPIASLKDRLPSSALPAIRPDLLRPFAHAGICAVRGGSCDRTSRAASSCSSVRTPSLDVPLARSRPRGSSGVSLTAFLATAAAFS